MARTYFKNLLQNQLARHRSKAKDGAESNTQTTKNILPCKPQNISNRSENQFHSKNINSERIIMQRQQGGPASKSPSSWTLHIKDQAEIEKNYQKSEQAYNNQLKEMREFMQQTLMNKYEYILFDNMLVSLETSVKNMLKFYRPIKKSNLPVQEIKPKQDQKKNLGYRRLNSQQVSTHSYFAQDPYDIIQTNPEKKQKRNVYMKKQSLQIELRHE